MIEVLNFFTDRNHFVGGLVALGALTWAACSIIETWRSK